VTPDGPDPTSPAETPMPVLPQDGYQCTDLNGGKDLQQTSESFPEPPTTVQRNVNVPPAVTAPAPPFLQCRMCDAPPTVGAQPTVTMCGHMFCSEYVLRIIAKRAFGLLPTRCITQHVMSTSRCPVCDNALLLYCLFKLDFSV